MEKQSTHFSRQSPAEQLAGGFAVFLFALLFLLPWWDRYLGLTNEGWYLFFGKQILAGLIPYRDFYLFVPPGQSLMMAGLTSVFGDRVIVAEMFGLIGSVSLALSLYVWMVRLFPAFWSALAVMCTTAIYFKGPVESLSGLQLNSLLFPVLAFTAANFALESDGGIFSCLAAGFFAGVAMVTKQTSGVATLSLVVLLPALIAVRANVRTGLRSLVLFFAAWCLPVLPVCLWLARNGAFGAFMNDAFLQGPSSKGSLASLLARQITGMFANRYQEISAAAAAILVVAVALMIYRGNERDDHEQNSARRTVPVLGFAALAIVAMIYAQRAPYAWPSRLTRLDFFFTTAPIYAGQFGSLILLAIYGLRWVRKQTTRRDDLILLAASASFICVFLFSFSWATGRVMLIPAFPFVASYGLSRLDAGKRSPLLKVAAAATAILCIAIMAGFKMRTPYLWADWRQGDALTATTALDFPELRGIRVTPETANFMNQVVSDIQQNSKPGDAIAEFETMPLLFSLSQRPPATFAYVHYIDITPDSIYRADAARLEKDPPAVIVFLDRSEAELREDEVNFRNGRSSGERFLWSELSRLKCRYRVVDVLKTPVTNRELQVWGRIAGEGSCQKSLGAQP